MIGIISDTHENEEGMKKAADIFKSKQVDFAVHCGDIISPAVLEHFAGLNMKIIFGNNDGEKIGLNEKAKELGFEEITDEKEFTSDGKKFYAYHGTDKEKLNSAISSNRYDYILTGHTHKKRDEKTGKTRVINPGSLFMAEAHTIAILDAENDELEFIGLEK